jgi:hypothetical protein
MKFGSVAKSDYFKNNRLPGNELDKSGGNILGCAVFEFDEAVQSRLSFDEGDKALMSILANHSIAFSVAEF